jgi:hypothetical protein
LRRGPHPELVEGGGELVSLLATIRRMIALYYEAGTKHGDELWEASAAAARMLLARAGARLSPARTRWCHAVPVEAAIALLLSIPIPLVGDYVGLESVLQSLPWIARAEAADFYLPEAYIELRRGKWQRSQGLALLQPRLDQERKKDVPTASVAKPGRNEPCPCGSGKKYKRCCGDSAASDRS